MTILQALPLAAIFFLISCNSHDSSASFQEQFIHANYICDDNMFLNVAYTKSNQHRLFANVILNGSSYKLPRVESASGEKYSDNINTWWSKGDTGFLKIDKMIILKNCSVNKSIKQMHPSWDINNDSINDCESDGSCDHTIDYSQPRKTPDK